MPLGAGPTIVPCTNAPLDENFATKPPLVLPLGARLVTGKGAAAVVPAMYALPAGSRATPSRLSSPAPSMYVEKSSAPDGVNFVRKPDRAHAVSRRVVWKAPGVTGKSVVRVSPATKA